MAHIACQVDRRLDRPVVCLAAVKRTHVGIAYRTPVQLHHQIRIALERTLNTPGELLNARHLVFAGNRRLAHIRLIDGKQRRRIIGRRQANRRLGHLGHTTLPPQKQRPPCAKPSARRPPSLHQATGQPPTRRYPPASWPSWCKSAPPCGSRRTFPSTRSPHARECAPCPRWAGSRTAG